MTSIINKKCTKSSLMLACRQTNSDTIKLLAWAPRSDIFTTTLNKPHNAKGTGWYYGDNTFWGFAPQRDEINNMETAQCDTLTSESNDKRLCLNNDDSGNGGWRCGDETDLNSDSGWEKLIFQKQCKYSLLQ